MADLADFRRAKDDFFRRAHDSPLTPEQRRDFHGLSYFDEDPAFRFELALDETTAGGEEEVEMSDGTTNRLRRAGTLRFQVDGADVALVAFEQSPRELFIPFRDATSGKETYGAGRYAEAERLEGNRWLVDFNRAYNPYCAYNEKWRCPLPPQENRLAVAIGAGEKVFPH